MVNCHCSTFYGHLCYLSVILVAVHMYMYLYRGGKVYDFMCIIRPAGVKAVRGI